MNSATSGNAMTEVALALAMAFFSLMVLTMVSMGTPQQPSQSANKLSENAPKIKLGLASASATKSTDKPTLVVFWKGRFLDQNLQSLDLNAQKFEGRVILALPPDLPMGQALDARAKIKAGNLVVSALNDKWLERLKTSPGKE